jgi:hypothetical protein
VIDYVRVRVLGFSHPACALSNKRGSMNSVDAEQRFVNSERMTPQRMQMGQSLLRRDDVAANNLQGARYGCASGQETFADLPLSMLYYFYRGIL